MDGSWGLMCAIHDSGGFRGREDYQEAKMSVSAGWGMNDTKGGGMNDTEKVNMNDTEEGGNE